MMINYNPEITFSLDNATINKDMLSALCYNLAQVGTTAKEAGDALRRLSVQVYDPARQEFKYTVDVLEDLARKWNEIGCTSFRISPEEVVQGLLRAETLGTTEIPNENESFDFLEQNAYDKSKNFLDGDNSGWLTPLDTI